MGALAPRRRRRRCRCRRRRRRYNPLYARIPFSTPFFSRPGLQGHDSQQTHTHTKLVSDLFWLGAGSLTFRLAKRDTSRYPESTKQNFVLFFLAVCALARALALESLDALLQDDEKKTGSSCFLPRARAAKGKKNTLSCPVFPSPQHFRSLLLSLISTFFCFSFFRLSDTNLLSPTLLFLSRSRLCMRKRGRESGERGRERERASDKGGAHFSHPLLLVGPPPPPPLPPPSCFFSLSSLRSFSCPFEFSFLAF